MDQGLSDVTKGFSNWVGLKLLLGTCIMGALAFSTTSLGIISLVFQLMFVALLLVTVLVFFLAVRRMFDQGSDYDG